MYVKEHNLTNEEVQTRLEALGETLETQEA